jgi:hypothetical protein
MESTMVTAESFVAFAVVISVCKLVCFHNLVFRCSVQSVFRAIDALFLKPVRIFADASRRQSSCMPVWPRRDKAVSVGFRSI